MTEKRSVIDLFLSERLQNFTVFHVLQFSLYVTHWMDIAKKCGLDDLLFSSCSGSVNSRGQTVKTRNGRFSEFNEVIVSTL